MEASVLFRLWEFSLEAAIRFPSRVDSTVHTLIAAGKSLNSHSHAYCETPLRSDTMLPSSYADIELLESEDLPGRTLVAPPVLARELRLALDSLDLTIQCGTLDAVLISSDLFQAFQQWQPSEQDADASDSHWN